MSKFVKYAIIVFLLSLLIGYFVGKFYPVMISKSDEVVIENVVGNTVTVGIPEETVIETSISEEKISPDANLIIEKEYQDCKHTITTNSEMPIEMVNLSKEEVEELYEDWTLKSFSEDEVSLYKLEDGICNEHFVITNDDEKITVYRLDEDYDKSLYQKTEISTEYLPEEDIKKLEEGIFVYGIAALNSELESFE